MSVASSYNLNFNAELTNTSIVVNAMGNTWDPTANGANGTGQFAAGTTFSAPSEVSGKNVHLAQYGSTSLALELVAAAR